MGVLVNVTMQVVYRDGGVSERDYAGCIHYRGVSERGHAGYT